MRVGRKRNDAEVTNLLNTLSIYVSYDNKVMKFSISIAALLAASVISSCNLHSDGSSFGDLGFDPLVAPGTRKLDARFSPLEVGSYVEAKVPNTSFYEQLPEKKMQPETVLAQGAALQILAIEKEFYRVRNVETGIEGYVFKNAVTDQPALPDIEPLDPEMMAALTDDIGVVNPALPPLPDISVLEPEGEPLSGDALAPDTVETGQALLKDEGASSDSALSVDTTAEKSVLRSDDQQASDSVLQKDKKKKETALKPDQPTEE